MAAWAGMCLTDGLERVFLKRDGLDVIAGYCGHPTKLVEQMSALQRRRALLAGKAAGV